jgi:Ser/Thr protein kinase RdoA (MazF antagonist)
VTPLDRDDGRVLITATAWADGRPLDPGDAGDSDLMGRTLAAVHASMREIDAAAVGPVAALRAVPVDPALGDQLLHGDVNHGNLRVDGDVVRLFDLDDCGRGPALFDVANAVYMARFSAAVGSEAGASFEVPFVTAYADASGAAIDRDVLEHLVDVRVRALLVWLDDLDQAPIGIRTAEPTWHAVLRRFAEDHLAG